MDLFEELFQFLASQDHESTPLINPATGCP